MASMEFSRFPASTGRNISQTMRQGAIAQQKRHWGFWSYAGTKLLIKKQDHRPAYTPKPPRSLGLARAVLSVQHQRQKRL